MVARKDTEYSRTQSISSVLRALAIVNKPPKSKSITGEGRPRNLNSKDVVSVHTICWCIVWHERFAQCKSVHVRHIHAGNQSTVQYSEVKIWWW